MECQALLLAVGDTLVLKVLETMGKRLVRTKRSRYQIIGDAPFHLAHTVWQVDDEEATKALRGAWDIVPLLVARHCEECGEDADDVIAVLDDYVHDLVITGTPHRVEELGYRFGTRLGMGAEEMEEAL